MPQPQALPKVSPHLRYSPSNFQHPRLLRKFELLNHLFFKTPSFPSLPPPIDMDMGAEDETQDFLSITAPISNSNLSLPTSSSLVLLKDVFLNFPKPSKRLTLSGKTCFANVGLFWYLFWFHF